MISSGVKGLAWTTVQSWVGVVIQILLMIILSRLINPYQFGLYAIALVPVALVSTLAELGLSAAIVRSLSDSRVVAGNAMTIALATSIVGVVITLVLAMSVYTVRGELTESGLMIVTLAPSVLILTLGSCSAGVLQRAQKFTSMAIIEIVAQLANVLVSISCAVAGYNAWALVFGYLTYHSIKATGSFILVQPRPQFERSELIKILSFSFGFVWLKLINTASSTVDRLLLSSVVGFEAVGFYQRATNIRAIGLSLAANPIDTFSYARLTASVRNAMPVIHEYDRALVIAILFSAPISIGIIIAAKEWMSLLFGEEWAPAGQLVQIAACALPFRAVDRASTLLARAYGKQGWRILIAGSTLLFSLLAIYLLINDSLEAAVIGVTIVLTISFIPGLWQAAQLLGVSLWSQLGKIVPGLLLWAVSVGTGISIKVLLINQGSTPWLVAFLTASFVAVLFLVICLLFPQMFFSQEPVRMLKVQRQNLSTYLVLRSK